MRVSIPSGRSRPWIQISHLPDECSELLGMMRKPQAAPLLAMFSKQGHRDLILGQYFRWEISSGAHQKLPMFQREAGFKTPWFSAFPTGWLRWIQALYRSIGVYPGWHSFQEAARHCSTALQHLSPFWGANSYICPSLISPPLKDLQTFPLCSLFSW